MEYKLPPAVVRTLREPAPTASDFRPTKFTPADTKAWFAFMWTVKPGAFRVVSQFERRLTTQVGRIAPDCLVPKVAIRAPPWKAAQRPIAVVEPDRCPFQIASATRPEYVAGTNTFIET